MQCLTSLEQEKPQFQASLAEQRVERHRIGCGESLSFTGLCPEHIVRSRAATLRVCARLPEAAAVREVSAADCRRRWSAGGWVAQFD